VIPKQINNELFDLKYKVNDVCIDHFCEQIESLYILTSEIDNFDHAIIINIAKDGINGHLRIDRILKRFEVYLKNQHETFMPVFGDWATIMNYLREVSNNN